MKINSTELKNIPNLIFEKVSKDQANTLVMFEQKIASPKLYGKPLDHVEATQMIMDNHFYFIKINGELVGTSSYKILEDNSFYISNIAVLPKWRSYGIARAAMNFLMEKSLENQEMSLVTHPDNFRAISLYQSLGFIITSSIENYYGDGEPRLIMIKS